MEQASFIVNQSSEAKKYNLWAKRIKDSIIAQFYNSEMHTFGSQTANAMALAFNIVPSGQEEDVLNSLVEDIKERHNHLNTGIMGVRFLFEVLTQHGYGELALSIMHQDTYPSFGDLINRGATTLWECWGEKEHDLKNGPRSLNHPMMGGYDNWFFNTLAGIRLDPDKPGFKHFYLIPHPIAGLKWIKCKHTCDFGEIESNWKFENGRFKWEFVIPQGTFATITLPFSRKIRKLGPGKYNLEDGVKNNNIAN